MSAPDLLGQLGLEVFFGRGVVGVNPVPVGLAFDHDRVGGGRKGERHRSGHRGDVHPHFGVGGDVEFGVDQVVGLLEGGVVVVDVGDDDALGVGAQQVPEVLLQRLGEVSRVLHVRLGADRALEQDHPVDVPLVADERRDEPVVVEPDRDDVGLHTYAYGRRRL